MRGRGVGCLLCSLSDGVSCHKCVHAVVMMAGRCVHILCGWCSPACTHRLLRVYTAICVCTSGCFVLHAASVPACVGLCAASCMAQWLLPNRAVNRRARWWQGLHARNGVLLLCVCVLWVWYLYAKPACSKQVLSQVYACALLCAAVPETHGHVCCLPCSLKLGSHTSSSCDRVVV